VCYCYRVPCHGWTGRALGPSPLLELVHLTLYATEGNSPRFLSYWAVFMTESVFDLGKACVGGEREGKGTITHLPQESEGEGPDWPICPLLGLQPTLSLSCARGGTPPAWEGTQQAILLPARVLPGRGPPAEQRPRGFSGSSQQPFANSTEEHGGKGEGCPQSSGRGILRGQSGAGSEHMGGGGGC